MRIKNSLIVGGLCALLGGYESSVNHLHSSSTIADLTAFPSAANLIAGSGSEVASIGSHAVIFHAEYVGGNVDDRKSVLILGENFNTFAPTRDDCLESSDGGNWTPCDKLLHASSTDYEIIATQGSNWPHVWIKVRGPDRLFSNAALVGK